MAQNNRPTAEEVKYIEVEGTRYYHWWNHAYVVCPHCRRAWSFDPRSGQVRNVDNNKPAEVTYSHRHRIDEVVSCACNYTIAAGVQESETSHDHTLMVTFDPTVARKPRLNTYCGYMAYRTACRMARTGEYADEAVYHVIAALKRAVEGGWKAPKGFHARAHAWLNRKDRTAIIAARTPTTEA